MGDVYNRKLFQAKARPAREKLAKMAGIMASSPELMQAANQGPKPPTPPMTGGARPMMPPPAPMMQAPAPQPMAPQLPQVPMQTAVAPAPMMQAPAPRPMAPAPAPAPMPRQQPVKFDEGGGVNIVDPATAIQTGAVEMGMSLYDKLKEIHGSEEKADAVIQEKGEKIAAALETKDSKKVSDAVLDAAGVKPTKENKMDFAANVLNLKNVNDINEIDDRIAQASLAIGVGKRVGGNTAIAEAVLLGLQNYKQTAAARAAGAGGAGMSPLEPFPDAVRDLAGKIMTATGEDPQVAIQQARDALAPYYSGQVTAEPSQEAPTGSGLPTVTTKEEYDALPSGSEFMQNGQRRKKP